MGNACSGNKISPPTDQADVEANVAWKQTMGKKYALQFYIEEGTVPKYGLKNLFDLREVLDDPVMYNCFVEYAKKTSYLEVLMCWFDIMEYKYINTVPDASRQVAKAQKIFQTFVIGRCADRIKRSRFSDGWIHNMNNTINNASSRSSSLSSHLFDMYQLECLALINTHVFPSVKLTKEYAAITERLKLPAVNKAHVDDFTYYEQLGRGSYGVVVRCVRKTTGKQYAMKIQTKAGLLNCFNDAPGRVMLEREAAVICQSEFIVRLYYAFQTPTLVFMLLDLGTCGTLLDALNCCPDTRMPESRVLFYSAEIILALSHIHRTGMIYRDLKPDNVLLCEDGHIKLVDFGGLIDLGGDVYGSSNPVQQISQLFVDQDGRSFSLSHPSRNTGSYSAEPANSLANSNGNGGKSITARATSVMGSGGYMAPEMLHIMYCKVNLGYSFAVDYWSLGILMYKLLSGSIPFKNVSVASFMQYVGMPSPVKSGSHTGTVLDVATDAEVATQILNFAPDVTAHPAMIAAFQELENEVEYLSSECMAVVARFLEVNENKRLGSRCVRSLRSIRSQEAYKDIDWSLLALKLVLPPSVPDPVSDGVENPPATSFKSMMLHINRRQWMSYAIPVESQQVFQNWDYIAPSALSAEISCSKNQSCV